MSGILESDNDDEVIIASAAFVLLSGELLKKPAKRPRRFWMSSLYKSRERYNATDLLSDLSKEPSGKFENFCRMSATDFENVLCRIGPVIGIPSLATYLGAKSGPIRSGSPPGTFTTFNAKPQRMTLSLNPLKNINQTVRVTEKSVGIKNFFLLFRIISSSKIDGQLFNRGMQMSMSYFLVIAMDINWGMPYPSGAVLARVPVWI